MGALNASRRLAFHFLLCRAPLEHTETRGIEKDKQMKEPVNDEN
jgi:hypothetical protein